MTEHLYRITRDGETVSGLLPTWADVLAWFHQRHSYSVDWATRYEGYTVHEVTPDALTESDKRAASMSVSAFAHGHRPSDRDDLTRENCSACALGGYGEHRDSDHGQLALNYAGWAVLFVDQRRPIPERYRAAFVAELNEVDESGARTPYAEHIARAVGAYGVRFC